MWSESIILRFAKDDLGIFVLLVYGNLSGNGRSHLWAIFSSENWQRFPLGTNEDLQETRKCHNGETSIVFFGVCSTSLCLFWRLTLLLLKLTLLPFLLQQCLAANFIQDIQQLCSRVQKSVWVILFAYPNKYI